MFARFALGFMLLCACSVRAQDLSAGLEHPPGVALVLSGGGIKGFAHIGVLDVLDSAHVPIDLIVGTSIGAVVGGLYADGYTPKQLEHFATTIDWADILELSGQTDRSEKVLSQKNADHALLSLRFSGFLHPEIPQAISSGERLTMLLNGMVLGAPEGVPQDFLRDLKVPFVAVTTDIVHGVRKLLTYGDFTEALRMSATLPLRFDPVPGDSTILMDGGLLDNIPTDVAKDFGAERILVSNTTAGLHPRQELTSPWTVADQVVTLMMQRENERELKLASCTITPDLGDFDETDFSNVDKAIEAGRDAARRMLPEILHTLAALSDPPSAIPPAGDTLLSVLHSVRILGSSHKFLDTAIRNQAPFLTHPLLQSQSMQSIEKNILHYYRSHGYSLARIDSVVVHPSVGRADVYVDDGHVRDVEVHGGDADIVRHELGVSTGDVFRAQTGERALHDLTGTGLFDYAVIQIHDDPLWPGTKYIVRNDTFSYPEGPPSLGPIVLLTVHAKSPSLLRLGAYADNEFGAEFSAELANENILGSGLEYALMGSLGSLARSASFTFDAPRLFHTFGVFDWKVYSGYRDINVYALTTEPNENKEVSNVTDAVREIRDFGISLRAGGQIERLGQLTVQLRAEHQRWFSLDSATSIPADNGSDNLRTVRAELLVDSRDDDDYPHSGFFLSSYAESGLMAFGAGTKYFKAYGDLETAIPLSSIHTLIPRIQIGLGNGLIPRLEEFALGGIGSFYGLNQYELRGQQMVEGSLTYQIGIPHALFFPTFVSMRYDIGATWPEVTQVKFESLRHGIGMQIGLKTPLGLAQFGIGETFRFVQDASSKTISVPSHVVLLNVPDFYFSIGARL